MHINSNEKINIPAIKTTNNINGRYFVLRDLFGDEISAKLLKLSGFSSTSDIDIKDISDIIHQFEIKDMGTIVPVNHDDGCISFTSDELLTKHDHLSSDIPICYYESGFISACLMKLTNNNYDVTETHCRFAGNKFCRWEAKKIELGKEISQDRSIAIDLISDITGCSISDMKKLHETEKMNEYLIEENKKIKESIGFKADLTKMIVHDMRVPLTAIAGSLEMLSDTIKTNQSAQVVKMMNIALSGSKMLVNMINDLQDIEKIEGKKLNLALQPTSVELIIEQAKSGIEMQANKKRIKIQQEIEQPSATIYADSERFTRVILNLLNNAIRFTPSGGLISIKAYQSDASRVCISIEDTGVGIPVENRDKIFEKYFQFDSSRTKRGNSCGLGLPYCKLMTEAHGGTITLEDCADSGSKFKLTIPICDINQ